MTGELGLLFLLPPPFSLDVLPSRDILFSVSGELEMGEEHEGGRSMEKVDARVEDMDITNTTIANFSIMKSAVCVPPKTLIFFRKRI